jgi:chemosensory pili system protein ChpA (sensor histidine kinase/response regulator)
MKDLASQSLDLVNRELSSTLETARREIEDFVDGQSGGEALLRAAGMLHLAAGALKIVEVQGAALLAEEMEQTCRALAEIEERVAIEPGVEALTRAMVQLPAYLERLLSGGRDVALVLLPLLNDLRKVRNRPLLSEGTLLLLNTGPVEGLTQTSIRRAGVDYGHELAKAAHKVRPVFQTALLGWIRGENSSANLDQLINASALLERSARADPAKQLWNVLAGVLVALRAGGLEASVQLKRLVGQADRQLKRLIDSGETAFANAPPVELLNSLLYYVARARSDDGRITKLRATYNLENMVPGEAQLERARERLAGPSVKLMHTVAEAIKEDLGAVKDVLDIFVRTGMEDASQLKPQIDMLKKIGDTLGVLGLEDARNQIQNEARQLSVIVTSNKIVDQSVLEKMAATLLDVEDTLDRELVRGVLPGGDEQGAEVSESEESTQYRHVTQAVMGECIVNLAKIKESVVKLVEESGNLRALDQVKPQLRGITAGLLMLNKTRAVKIIERIGAMITERLAPSDLPLRPDHLERLADAIVSVEYYMETVTLGRTDPWYMLENAERCLELLERLPVTQVSRPAERRPAPAPAPAPPRAAAAPVMQVDEERSDPELVEVFIEEAKEEFANVERCLPLWTKSPENSEALISVRRSFHTLKGSGRMVGAQLLGEFAWSIENLLNRLINQTLAPNPAMLEFITEAAAVLPALIEQLEIGIAPKVDVHLLMKRAEAFAVGDPDAESLTSESLRVPALAVEPAPVTAPAGGMDPVLSEIFVKEMRGHLAAIRDFVENAERGAASRTVTEPLHRASHTLLGSARMANSAAVMALAQPLNTQLAAHYAAGSALTSEGLAVLRDVVTALKAMADAIAAGDEGRADATLIERLAVLAPSVATADLQQMPVDEAPAAEVASYDPEIAAIFAEEAAELLDQAESAFQDLDQSQDSPAVLRELQRLLHTLKGGARMAGVLVMGDLSHALETLLADLLHGNVATDAAATGLVQRCLDHLHQMRDAIDSGHPVPAATALMAEIANSSARVEGAQPSRAAEAPRVPEQRPMGQGAWAAEEELPAPVAEPTAVEPALIEPTPDEAPPLEDFALTAEDIQSLEAIDLGAAEGADVGADAAAADAALPDAAEATVPVIPAEVAADLRAGPAPGQASARGPERAETSRVDAALLDALLNGAGEISIFQSRLKQQLHSIEFHLSELAETVKRLREQLRNLEAETEAQILHRHQDDAAEDQVFDPLELDRYSTIQQLSRALAETSNDVASINELLHGLTSEADTLLTQQARVTSELQDGLMQTRMVSLQRHVARLARIVRQAAIDVGKSAELVVTGANSELDRQVLDSILPAFEHLLRNAVVHGIEDRDRRRRAGKPESGVVDLKLRRDGSEVLIEVSDDGAGLDFEAIRRKAREQGLLPEGQTASDEEAIDFILRPGFSTAGELTQAAGRGVGMDVVDTEIKKLGGSMRIESRAGLGTHFIIRLPYTLAVTHALIVNVGDETFALPLPTVEGITRVRREQLLEILTQDEPTLDYGGVSYRVQHLGSLVGSAPSALPEDEHAVSLVLVRAGEHSTALLTDSLEGSREIVVKTLGPHIASVPGVSGATILGDGRIIVILDAGTLVRSQQSAQEPAAAPPAVERPLSALVVDDSITMRRVTQRLLERRAVKVLTARDGLDAITVLQEHEVDIILLDIEMPRMDGYQFATHVRNDPRVKHLPIIMITSRSGEKHRAKAIEIGVNDYLSKPYQESQLVNAIEALLGRRL